jgi:D-arginine dehydrogenase
MAETPFDIAIIGAGIGGASLAATLPPGVTAILLEAEPRVGYHATGRSAALFTTLYGNTAIRALSRASEAFFQTPPAGFTTTPLTTPRSLLFIARADQLDTIASLAAELAGTSGLAQLSADEARRCCPLLRQGYVAEALHDETARDLDVDALHQGFLRRARALGLELRLDARVLGLDHGSAGWSIATTAGCFDAKRLVNAAGAWADEIGVMAGAGPKRIRPLRRTALVADLGAQDVDGHGPFVVDVEERFYFKPESGGLLMSPADEDPVVPGDVQPEELDVAIAIDRVEQAIVAQVRRVRAKWAGLRSFAPDRTPVVGFDPDVPDLFWLAGQGGYGIQAAPALAEVASALLSDYPLSPALLDHGVDSQALSPARAALRR